MKRYVRTIGLIALALAIWPGFAQPADLPCRAVKLIIPWAAGGDTDVIMREFGLAAQEHLGMPIVVQNVGGQGGNKGAKMALDARPDGCTLFSGHDSMATSYLQGRVDFNHNAFEPIALLTHTPSVIGANPKTPWKTAKELIEDAKQHPDTVSKENLEQGKLKALGIASEKRAPQIPEIPTLKEQGINVIFGVNRGWFAPKGTKKEVIDLILSALSKAATDKRLVKDLYEKGTYVDYRPGAKDQEFLDAQLAEMTGVAKKVGLYQAKK